MREGLAREFPEAVRALGWTRARLPERMALFSHEPVLWATVSAIGAGFVVSAVTRFLVALVVDALQVLGATTAFVPGWPQTILGTSAAVAVALRAGGALSVTLYLIYIALDIALRIPGVITFCERSGFQSLTSPDMCTPFGFLAGQWALWTGIGVGLLLSRAIAARGHGQNRSLHVAGAYAVASAIMVQVWAATITQGGDAAGALNGSLTLSVLTVAVAVVAGVVASLSEHRVRSAGIVAAILLLPWLTSQLPYLASVVRSSPEFAAPIIVSTVSTPIAAIVLILTALVSDRHRFIPREAA
jgi:hypothetical protein